jgi:hypothetical protein
MLPADTPVVLMLIAPGLVPLAALVMSTRPAPRLVLIPMLPVEVVPVEREILPVVESPVLILIAPVLALLIVLITICELAPIVTRPVAPVGTKVPA